MTEAGGTRDIYARIETLLDAARTDDEAKPPMRAALQELTSLLHERTASAGSIEPSPRAQRCFDAIVNSPVFVVGGSRSGTTLAINLLDSHPQLGVYPFESYHFSVRWSGDRPTRIASLQHAALRQLINPFNEPPYWLLGRPDDEHDPYERFSSYFNWFASRNENADLLSLLASALTVTRLDEGDGAMDPRYWVEKTPGNELLVDEILAVYPEARFVQLVRDPRAIAASSLGYQRDRPNVLVSARETHKSLTSALRNAERLGPERFLIIRYEDLVLRQRETLASIVSFLGIDFDESLVTPTVVGQPARANSSWPERRVAGQIHEHSLESWRDRLDARSLAVVIAFAGRPARALGYDVRQPLARTLATRFTTRLRGALNRLRAVL